MSAIRLNRFVITTLIFVATLCTAFVKPSFELPVAAAQKDTMIRDSLIDQFAGTWIYKSRDLEVKLVLKKIVTSLPSPRNKIFVEQLNGGYVVVKNSKEIINTLVEKPLYGNCYNKKPICTLLIDNYKYSKDVSLFDKKTALDLHFIDPNTIIIEKGAGGEGVKFDEAHQIPLHVKFHRQKI
ncbi:MAG: hypothetical protein EOO88_12815 [Pedobacter sp.]|nr:MAG: hypothetical protein EOO88_12815 [Pedobacter sp.]